MRVAVLSDIHSNLEALDAVLNHSVEHDVETVWFLGDAVGYGGDPAAVVEWLRKLEGDPHVRGNHDKVVAGIEEPDSFSAIAKDAALQTRGMLTPENTAFLRRLQQGPVHVSDEVALCHGSWWDEDYYVLHPSDAAECFRLMRCDVLFFGHTHRAGLYAELDQVTYEVGADREMDVALRRDARYVVNPGSVGQPRDRDPRAAYAVFDTEDWTLRFHRVAYDVAGAQQRIVSVGLPAMNAARLSEGR
jgi:predicted phosphodiesterase